MQQRLCVVCGTFLSGKQAIYCSNNCKQKHHWERLKVQTNSMHSQTRRALQRKLELIDLLGGSCACCGYNKNVSALHFHHKFPNEKLFNLDQRKLSNTRLALLKTEVAKCVLLCANCHAEHHNPDCDRKEIEASLAPIA